MLVYGKYECFVMHMFVSWVHPVVACVLVLRCCEWVGCM